MRRWLATGFILLALQGTVLVFREWPRLSVSPDATQQVQHLLDADTQVQQIQVLDERGNQSLLVRQGEHWLLPGAAKLPADADQVRALLETLTAPRHEWPAASTSAARQRFHVADYLFQRQLTLEFVNGGRAVIYLGTSPGFRKVHARREGQQEIYAITYNAHEVPATDGGWLDPRILQTRSPLTITADAYSLIYDGGQWRSGLGLPPQERELESLLGALRDLQVLDLADEQTAAELAQVEAQLELSIESLAGNVTLALFKKGEDHYIRSSQYSLFFKLSEFDYSRLTNVDLGLISGDT